MMIFSRTPLAVTVNAQECERLPLSSGYVGIRRPEGTLNSAFYGEYLNSTAANTEWLVFPQRVPRSGFFKELAELENSVEFSILLHSKIDHAARTIIDPASEASFFNQCNFLLRYGAFDAVSKVRAPNGLNPSDLIELELIKATAQINKQLSVGEPVNLLPLQQLVAIAEQTKSVTDRTKLRARLRYVVSVFRYSNDEGSREQATISADSISKDLECLDKSRFNDQIMLSIAYRGISMARGLSKDRVAEYVRNLEKLLVEIKGRNILESLVEKENIYTSLQTLAKWELQQGNIVAAEQHLKAMTRLDPFDSTGYCELGLFLMKQGKFEEAAKTLGHAVRLGPPGLGMLMYYQAKCYQELGNQKEAQNIFISITELDPTALSPWLELLEYYGSTNFKLAKRIAKKIIDTPVLSEQLDETENARVNEIISHIDS